MLKPGDIFVAAPPVGSPHFVSNLIISISGAQDVDGKAKASHAGIILDSKGTTFEALAPGYIRQNIWEAYKGCRLLIGRHRDMNPSRFDAGWEAIKYLEGRSYPEWRLILFAINHRLASVIHYKRMVCSEKTFRFLAAGGCRKNNSYGPIDYWWGVPPAHIEDAICGWDAIDEIYNSF